MKISRLQWCAAGLILPTLLVVFFSVFFLVEKIPELQKDEQNRVKSAYRESALEMRETPEYFTRIDEIPKDGKVAGKMAPGRWGYSECPQGGYATVWYDDRRNVYAREVELVEATSSVGGIVVSVVALLVLLVLMTGIVLWFFVNYARVRDDFVAATVHDLKTPIVALRRIVVSDPASASLIVERMMLLVKNLESFLRLGGKRPNPQIGIIDLRETFSSAYKLLSADFEWQLGEPLELEGPDEVKVFADGTLLLQILWNLLQNELKYAVPYGPIRARLYAPNQTHWALQLIDNGLGLTKSERKKVFSRYYRAKSVMKSGKGGFGIGLTTAREFARAMGGDLQVSPNVPNGCVFTLSLRRVS